MRQLALLTLTCALVVFDAFSTASAVDFSKQIDPLAAQLIDDHIVVGMIVGIVKGDETQLLAYGETRRGSDNAPTVDSLYEVGSITKVFTGVLLADAVLTKRVELDDPLQQHLAEAITVPMKEDAPITLRHLATHTSGLPRMPSNFNPRDAAQPYADYDLRQMHAFLNGHTLRRKPGEYEYSNFGAGLLGQILAQRYKMPYEQALVERIFSPLKMKDTRITLSDDQRRRLATGYNVALEPEPAWEFDAMAPAGGVRSTMRDMLAFVRANLAEDDKPVTLALHDARKQQPVPDDGQAMALGWHIARDGVTRWHNGMTGGYHSWLGVVPSEKLGVVVLANTATMRVSQFGEQVTRIAFGLEVQHPPRRKEVAVDEDILRPYVGTYHVSDAFAFDVRLEDGKLMVQATGQPQVQVFAESPTKFFYKVVDAQITFHPNGDGEVNKLTLHQGGRNIEAVRRK